MGRLKTLTFLLTVGAWVAATDGAPPDDPTAAATPSTQKAPPGTPSNYLRAVARLYRERNFPLAARYLKAADRGRDQLTTDEKTELDRYQVALSRISTDDAVDRASTEQPATATAAAAEVTRQPAMETPAADAENPPRGASQPALVSRSGMMPSKQNARWLLQAAREQIRMGNYDEASEKVAEARSMNIRWGLFDDTPAKVAESIEKARPRPQATEAARTEGPGDHRTAKARLKEARAMLASGDYEKAEAVAIEVNKWGLSYGMLEDNPAKVASAARALRRRDSARTSKGKAQTDQAIYDELVQESRQLLRSGRINDAELKALRAQRMNVAPAVSAVRAEEVLRDVEVARTQAAVPTPNGAAPARPAEAAAAAERDANELLAQGQGAAARAKFDESQRLEAGEAGRPSPAPANGLVPPDAPESLPEPSAVAVPDTIAAPAAAGPAPAQAAAPVPSPAENPAEQSLAQARDLMSKGNYPAARQAAQQARSLGGVDKQADELLSQIGLAEQQGALQLYEAALASVRKGDTGRARALLAEVAAASAAFDDAFNQKVQDLLIKLPREKDGKAAVSDLVGREDEATVAAQKLNVEVGTKIAESRRLMETDPDKAIQLLQATIASIKAEGLSEAVTRTMVRRVEVTIELAKKDKAAFDVKMQDKAYRAEIEQKRLRILEADKAKKVRLKELMDKAQVAMQNGNYAEAESMARKAAEIDPNELAPGMLAWKANAQRHYETDLKIKQEANEGYLTAFQDVDKSAIIPAGIDEKGIVMGKSFTELSDYRRKTVERLAVKKSPKAMAIERKLQEPVTLNMHKQPLEEAVNFLRAYTGLNIVTDPKAMGEEGVVPTTPVDLTVNGVKLKTALKLILQPLGLTWKVDEDVLVITSPQNQRTDVYPEVYDVADLVLAPHLGTKSATNPLLNTNGNALNDLNAGMPGLDPNTPPIGQVPSGMNAPVNGATEKEGVKYGDRGNVDMSPLIQLITTTIAPGTWRIGGANGDSDGGYGLGAGAASPGGPPDRPPGSITPFFLNISLIIRHTAEVHDQVVDLLRQLRRLQDLQVSIEVRFITINDNFFEQIGVDFDFSIHSDAVTKHSSFAQVNPANLANAGGTGGAGGAGGVGGAAGTAVNPVIVNPFRDHTFGNKVPLVVGRAGPGDTGNFTPDLQIPFLQNSANVITPFNAVGAAATTFGISFLSDLEVYLFLTAIQGDVRSNIVQAPKVTTFNGANATVFNFTSRSYISQLIPIVGAGAVAFQPIPAQIPDGVTLNVTPVVTADRRYVRLTMAPQFLVFDRFDTFPVVAAVGGGGLGGGATAVTGQIQLPIFNITRVITTVTVPDGGTVLLGGVKSMQEVRNEFGTPVLSKIPLINRLFRNIGVGRTSRSLMMMVTPRIIILEEEEERLGIPSVVPTVSL